MAGHVITPSSVYFKCCFTCGVEKPGTEFGPRSLSRSRDGLNGSCRACVSTRAREYHASRDPVHRQNERAKYAAKRGKVYVVGVKCGIRVIKARQERPAREAQRQAERAARQEAKAVERAAIIAAQPWRDRSLTDRERYRLRYRLDAEFNLSQRMKTQHRKAAKRLGVATLIRGALCRNGVSRKAEQMLGYSMADLRIHIGRQFTKGMDWHRFAAGEIHIDHILPVASFDLSSGEEFRACWAMTNLRPLWAACNLEKSARRLHLL